MVENYFTENEDSNSLESIEEMPTEKAKKILWTCGLQIEEKEEDKDSDPSKSTEEKLAEKSKKKPQNRGPLIKNEGKDDPDSSESTEKKPIEKLKKKKP